MLFYELKVNYSRQTGEDNPGKVKETYLVEGFTCADVEERVMEVIKPFIFQGDCEVSSCRKVQYYDLIPQPDGEYWYKARVELITVENDKETRKAQSILVQADNMLEALQTLKKHLAALDCEIIGLAKSPVVDVIRAIE